MFKKTMVLAVLLVGVGGAFASLADELKQKLYAQGYEVTMQDCTSMTAVTDLPEPTELTMLPAGDVDYLVSTTGGLMPADVLQHYRFSQPVRWAITALDMYPAEPAGRYRMIEKVGWRYSL